MSVFRASIPNTGKTALKIITDAPVTDRAVWIDVQDPHPQIGDVISWTTGHVIWNGVQIRKRGYAFDPDAPLH